MGRLGFMLDFHFASLIFKELQFFMNGNSIYGKNSKEPSKIPRRPLAGLLNDSPS